jgi:4-hydroxy-3-methylbut-2-enyl diphosphate reductase IspH
MYKTEKWRVIIEQIKESIAQMEQPIIKDICSGTEDNVLPTTEHSDALT